MWAGLTTVQAFRVARGSAVGTNASADETPPFDSFIRKTSQFCHYLVHIAPRPPALRTTDKESATTVAPR